MKAKRLLALFLSAAILAQGIPVHPLRLEGELCTPSSAAMILHFVDGFEEGATCG